MKIRSLKILIILLIFTPGILLAARMANMVDKTFNLTGEQAKEAAALLGISNGEEITLPWGDTPGRTICKPQQGELEMPDCEEIPTKDVKIVYKAGVLKLSGSWRDLITGSGEGFESFSISSPVFKQSPPEEWEDIHSEKLLNLTPEQEDSYRKIKRLSSFKDHPPSVSVSLYEWDDKKMLMISVDFDTPEKRREKIKSYNECRKRSRGMLDGGC